MDFKKKFGSNLAIMARPSPIFRVIWQCLAMISGKGKIVNKEDK